MEKEKIYKKDETERSCFLNLIKITLRWIIILYKENITNNLRID